VIENKGKISWLGGRESVGPIRGSKGRSITYGRSCSGSVIYALSVTARDFRSFSDFFQFSRCDVTRHVTRENSILAATPACIRSSPPPVRASAPSTAGADRHRSTRAGVPNSPARATPESLCSRWMRSARERACLTRDTRTILKGSVSVVRNSLSCVRKRISSRGSRSRSSRSDTPRQFNVIT
jgi:hypothetical protein